MLGSEIRRKYVEFFREKGHEIVPSASLVPRDDASLLWINSGMAPLKRYFDGRETPDNLRLTNSQKCIRTNDIELVGKTARHHTFFEMMGNFSIGDYFKREAIHWAWEFVTQRINLDVTKLSVTIHPEDDEAFAIWHREIGLSEERILRLEENFWDIGEGPCGPNSEIFFDRGPDVGCGRPECDASCDCDRHLEIWNLVFSQYNHNPDGSYTPLPKKNIDTGMGLERTASVVQGVPTNYDTDFFRPIIDETARQMGLHYGDASASDTALKVIADHVRAVVFSISDGVLPSNEGRGYVIRRLLRRAVRYGKQFGLAKPFLYTLVSVVGQIMGDYYPEILEKSVLICDVIRREEERFFETLVEGEYLLGRAIEQVQERGETVLSGEAAFKLYDTYGFPIDLTEEIAAENQVTVDRDGFAEALLEQRVRARNARREVRSMQVQTTFLRDLQIQSQFVGYNELLTKARIELIITDDQITEMAELGESIVVILDKTPFYAESGGQTADHGVIAGDGFELLVHDVQKGPNGQNLHACTVAHGVIHTGSVVSAVVDASRRMNIAKNHTATHLLHKALREVLGEHVAQAGSLVEAERLRFDFSHVGGVSDEELMRVERLVNEQMWVDGLVTTQEMDISAARSLGAMALFGEKYGDVVRVVRAGDYSIELCGGCHVQHTGQIGLFKVISETGIGSGIRRLEATTGRFAYEFVRAEEELLHSTAKNLRTTPAQLPKRVEGIVEQVKGFEQQVEQLTGALGRLEAVQLLHQVVPMPRGDMLVAELNGLDVDGLRSVADSLKSHRQDVLMLLASAKSDRLSFVVVVPSQLQKAGVHAGKLVQEISKVAGGSGGGKPDLAQAGAKDVHKLPETLTYARELIARMLTDETVGAGF